MNEQLFVKRNRRYYPWGNGTDDWRDDRDAMQIGTYRLISCPEPGLYRTQSVVNPDLAGFLAAADIAYTAMCKAITEEAMARPQDVQQFTPEQMAIIERYRTEMAEAGGMFPAWWLHSSNHDIAQAGINAVKQAFKQALDIK